MSMKVEKVVFHGGGFQELFTAWADQDGRARAERVATAMRSGMPVDTGALRDSVRVVREQHRTRPVFHVGPTEWYGMIVESKTGAVSRALDAGAGA